MFKQQSLTITYASLVVPAAAGINLPNGTAVNIATVPLQPGQWVINGEVWFNVTNGTPSIQQLAAVITDTSATVPTEPAAGRGVNVMEINQSRSAGTQVGFVLPIAGVFVSVTTQLDYYLVAYATWTGVNTALSAYGKLAGRMTPNPTPF